MQDAVLKVGLIDMESPEGTCAHVLSGRQVIIASGEETHAKYGAVYYLEKPNKP